jgi:hypothetical protein
VGRGSFRVCGDTLGRGCNQMLPLNRFHVQQRKGRDVIDLLCKPCRRVLDRERRAAMPRERLVEWGRRYRERNREAVSERDRAYYEFNRADWLDRSKRRYEAKREDKLAKQRVHYAANKERILERRRRRRAEKCGEAGE